VNRIFKENAGSMDEWAKNNASNFNMSRNEAIKYSSIYGNLISNITEETAENATLTQELLKKSAIVASATGRTMEDVMDRIRSGLLGNTEAIEDLGINVNVAMLESTEAFKRFAGDSSWQKLDFQTQQQIRLMAILEQASKKYGDEVAQNTNASLARLNATMKNTVLNIGQGLKPILDAILPSLISFAQSIERITLRFAQFMQVLFGVSDNGMQNLQEQSQKATTGIGGVGDAVEEANKKAKGSVAGFDEINQLTEKMAKSADSAGGGIGGIGLMPKIEDSFGGKSIETMEEMKKKVEEFKKEFEFLKEPIDKVKKSFVQLMKAISDLWNSETMVKFRAWIAQRLKFGVTRLLELLNGSLEILTGTFEIVTGILNGDWKKAWAGAEKVVQGLWDILESTAISIFGEEVKPILDEFEKNWKEGWTRAKEKTVEFFKELPEKWAEFKLNMTTKWNNFWDGLSEKIFYWKNYILKLWSEFRTGLFEKWENLKTNFAISWAKFWESIGVFFSNFWGGIKKTFVGVINSIIGLINKLIGKWNQIEFKVPKISLPFGGEFGGGSIRVPQINPLRPIGSGDSNSVGSRIGSSIGGLVKDLSSGELADRITSGVGTAFIQASQFAQQAESGQEVKVNIDGTELIRMLIPKLNQEQTRTGTATVITTQ
jgi:hypothetical protein